MTTIMIGENRHLLRQFYQADGVTPLLRTALASLTCELWQGTTLRATYVYGTAPELSAPAGIADNAVQLELTKTFTAATPAGKLTEVWTLTLTDASYVGGSRVDKLKCQDITLEA